MSYNYLKNGLNYQLTKEVYHHKVLKITAPKIKRLRKEMNKLHKYYLVTPKVDFDFIEYDIKHDIITSQINALENL